MGVGAGHFSQPATRKRAISVRRNVIMGWSIVRASGCFQRRGGCIGCRMSTHEVFSAEDGDSSGKGDEKSSWDQKMGIYNGLVRQL